MPGATPAGSPGGTGVSHCQQQALVVGRFVFPLSLVLGLSPRTRLSCSYWISWCFFGLDQAVLHPAHVRDDRHRAHPGPPPAGAWADLPKSRGGEGRQLLAPQQRQLSRTAAQHPETETLLFLGASIESLGPAADRHQTARPVPERRIRAFTALFTETFYGPPLCMVKVVSFHC